MSENSSYNGDWWRKVNLPKTKSEWQKAASSEKFEEPKQRGNDDINAQNLHVGENPIDVHLRDPSEWMSASKIQDAHFLTTRILWNFVSVHKLSESSLLSKTHLTKEANELSWNYLKGFRDWKRYRDDITARGMDRPALGAASARN